MPEPTGQAATTDASEIPGAPEFTALRTLRRYTEGTLAFAERRAKVRFVVDNASARLVLPVEPRVLEAQEHVLYLPEETGAIIQLLLSVEPLANPAGHEAPDRWLAYHTGQASAAGTWIAASVEAGKTETLVYPTEEFAVGNVLRKIEPRLVKMLNADRKALAAACMRARAVEVAEPLAVGVDPLGIDVRARFGVLRLEFAEWAGTEAAVLAAIRSAVGVVVPPPGAAR